MIKERLAKRKLQQSLIQDFMENFYKELGYYPTVITKYNNIENKDGLKILTLDELKSYFTPHLPKMYGKTVSLESKHRIRALVELRYIFFFLARSMRYNLKDIGQFLGGKDHTTIIHGITTFRNRYETDDMFRELYYKIINKIKQDHESSTMEHPSEMEFKS